MEGTGGIDFNLLEVDRETQEEGTKQEVVESETYKMNNTHS